MKKNKSGACQICGKPLKDYYICEDCAKKIKHIENYEQIAETEEEKKFIEILNKNKGN